MTRTIPIDKPAQNRAGTATLEEIIMHRLHSVLIGALLGTLAASASAEELAVGNYGVSANGMPFGVAMAKGYFKDEGINVTGLITSAGGGTSLRNMLAGRRVPYGEVNPGVVVSAILAGADLKIISDNVLTVAEFVWAVKPDSPIKSIKDFKGKKIGYTNPRSTSQALARMLLHAGGYTEADAELVKTGGFGEGIAALDSGQIDVAAITEPLWSKVKHKYRAVVSRARCCRRSTTWSA
jgi:NitT/TauT family transport system substrate-binding protein